MPFKKKAKGGTRKSNACTGIAKKRKGKKKHKRNASSSDRTSSIIMISPNPGPPVGQNPQREENIHPKGVGKKTMQKLHEGGFRLVSDLQNRDDFEFIANKCAISIKMTKEIIAQTKIAKSCCRPSEIDHRKADNPYKSRYPTPPDLWRTKIENSVMLGGYRCITHLIEHIVLETKACFRGTKHESDCLFYHDALSLMTAKRTRDWMREKGYEKMWILPENDLFANEKLKAYRGRPAGNSPELCSLDSNLNRDVHIAVSQLVDNNNWVCDNDDMKFSMSTPKEGTKAYLRVFDPVKGIAPSSKRILQDTNGVMTAIKRIVESEGCVIADINNRSGKRRGFIGKTQSSRWGGGRKRKQAPSDYGIRGTELEKATSFGQRLKLEVSKVLYHDGVKCEGINKKATLEASMKKTRGEVVKRFQQTKTENSGAGESKKI